MFPAIHFVHYVLSRNSSKVGAKDFILKILKRMNYSKQYKHLWMRVITIVQK
jgi:hypothetical protein